MKRSDTLNKHVDYSGLNTAGNILDYACTRNLTKHVRKVEILIQELYILCL